VGAITGAALTALLQTCAPNVTPATMHAIVTVESGGDPWVLNDNTTGIVHKPRSYAEALSTERDLIGRGHSVDVGIAQVNSSNFAGYHLTPAAALMPCQNLIVGSAILANAYRWSLATYGDQRQALWGSVSAYNTGSLTAGGRYVNLVVGAAASTPFVPSIDLLRGVGMSPVHFTGTPSAGVSATVDRSSASRPNVTRKTAHPVVSLPPDFCCGSARNILRVPQ
jgi:type IV secretion system protein VirB1